MINQSGRGGLRKHLCDLLRNIDYDLFEVWIAYNDAEVDDIFRETIKELTGKVNSISIDTFVRELDVIKDIKTYIQLSQLIKKIKPDIVHCHSSKAGVLGRIASKRRKIDKIFYTPHWYSFLSKEFSDKKVSFFISIERFLSLHATTKTFNTSYGEKEAALMNKIDLECKFKVIYNGLPEVKLPDKKDIRKELGIPKEAFLFGNSARISHQKNPFLFIEIANEVIKKNKSIHFLWIGDGPLMEEVKSKIHSLNILDNFHLIGSRDDSEFLVRCFDGFLSTSNGESFGYSAVEALRAGVPVLLSDVMGHNEVCVPYINGILFDQKSSVSEISNSVYNFIEWKKISNEKEIINSFNQRFSLDCMIEKIITEYGVS